MLFFRADGNNFVGAGHIMRCLSIADAGMAAGQPSRFITSDAGSSDLILKHGHQQDVLHTSYMELDCELAQMKDLLKRDRPDILFVDSYYVTEHYLKTLSAACHEIKCKLVYLDDVMAFAYTCDFLINYNIYGPDWEERYKNLYEKEDVLTPRLLLGASYAPLRKEFQNQPVRVVKDKATEILISTGGSDPEHLGVDIANYILKHRADLNCYHFHFVIGSMNDDRERLERIADHVPFIITHYNVQNMSQLMQGCDLAISAAGSTLYELCATQTPTITYVLADNQVPGAEAFERHGGLRYVGDVREAGARFVKDLLDATVELANNREERMRIAGRQRELVDGRGAKRIIARLTLDHAGMASIRNEPPLF